MNEQKPEQVLYVWNYLEWGGAQVYFLGIASRIKDRTKVKFIFPRETNRQFINFCENLGIEYEFLEGVADFKPATTLKRKFGRHLNKIQTEISMLRYLRKFELKDSILHIELAPWQSVLALSRLCLRRAKVFMTMHNALPSVSKWRNLLWKLKFSIVTRFDDFYIFASNQDAKNSLKPFVPKEFFEKIKVTYTNVNPDEADEALRFELNREDILKKFGLPKDRFFVFCLGQFIDRKGRWTFLEAAKKILKDSPDICFVWISNSDLTAEESAKIESYDLGDGFFLVKSEAVGDEHLELMKFLRIADVFALPSFVEGLPISLLEAMSLGIPSISTNVYAIPEAVKNGETGILIEAGDSDALAEAVKALKDNEALRKTLGQSGREWVLANFNEKTVAEIAFQSYAEAFEQNK
ncbi:MAG TPA: glycosyltransferase family 4 protein [Pyrinomonadaceae bacterium]|nr:glycosyltransferase family 4 protein [Pyrinomonadaceae bacterium]